MSTTATDRSPLLHAGLEALGFSRRTFNKLLDSIPEAKLTAQPVAGMNHAAWLAGHVAMTDDFFLSEIAGQDPKCPAEWKETMWMGSTAVDDPSKYPPMSELRAMLADRRQALCDWFASRSDEQLIEKLPEDWQGFAENYAVLMSTIAAHETMHAGQLTVVRKGLGLNPVFG